MASTAAPRPSEGTPANRERTKRDKVLIAAILGLFSAGATGYGMLLGMRAALVVWGLDPEVAAWLGALASEHLEPPPLDLGPPGPMEQHEAKQAPLWRAIYILGAAQRLSAADDLDRAETVEQGYFDRQVAAEARRDRASALVDMTSRLLSDRTEEQARIPLLGWRAVLDDKTTPECRWANGQNFRADRVPIIGVPGAVHPRCRCTAGPPIKGAPLIPSL